MALFDQVNPMDYILVGNKSDWCILCAKEVRAENREEYVDKQKQLAGKLEGETVVKFRYHGNDLCVCMDHIRKIAIDYPKE